MKHFFRPIRQAVLCALFAAAAQAQTVPPLKVEGAWARASVPGQMGTGAFMKLTAAEPLVLMGVSSPAAAVAEVHEMKMQDDVMKMRAVAQLELPAGKTVELRPGSYHVMLMDLKAPLTKDSTVPLTLRLRNGQGTESRLELRLPVMVSAPTAASRH